VLFDLIAPVYGLFFHHQRQQYAQVLERAAGVVDLSGFHTAVDIGCGTGALCSVLKEKGLQVTGVDAAGRMLAIARRKPENRGIEFVQADVLKGLPFPDKSFDVAFSSYVAHGLKAPQRKVLYEEMGRLAREYVIIHDYNDRRSPWTSLAEWLEGGDYFRFIRQAEREMAACFTELRVIPVGERANWYVGKP